MADLERRPPTEPVGGPRGDLPDAPRLTIVRAADLDDATLEEIGQSMIEQWRPQMKTHFISVAIGTALMIGVLAGAIQGMWPLAFVYVAMLPTLALTPLQLWRQQQIQNEAADRLGVSRALLMRLWKRQFRLGLRPSVFRDMMTAIPKALMREAHQQHTTQRYLRIARDELATEEIRLLGTPRA